MVTEHVLMALAVRSLDCMSYEELSSVVELWMKQREVFLYIFQDIGAWRGDRNEWILR